MTTTTDLIALQPGQPDEGMNYNPSKSLPYPIFVGLDDRCENVPGYPLVRSVDDRVKLPILVGFQPDLETQRVEVLTERWRTSPTVACGMVPVFFEPGGASEGMFNLTVVITSVDGKGPSPAAEGLCWACGEQIEGGDHSSCFDEAD